jgi:hypothetical protein
VEPLAIKGLCWLAEAGFIDVRATVHPVDLKAQMLNDLHQQGAQAYLASVWQALATPSVRQAFLNREMFVAYCHFRQNIGYGLYVGKKGWSETIWRGRKN